MENPLLNLSGLPPFSRILPEHVEPAIDSILADNRLQLEKILAGGAPFTWENLIYPLEVMEDRLSRAWSPVSHMNSVVNNEALRDAYNTCLTKLSQYSTEMGQNQKLFEAFRDLATGPYYESLDEAQKKIINDGLRDFKLSGVALSSEDKKRYKDIAQELSSLSSKFGENVLDATNAWKKLITDEDKLHGVPESGLGMFKQNAELAGQQGWLLTLDFPSYFSILSYADDRALREEMYCAFVTRASDEGPNAGEFDNTPIMARILELRHAKANLLGFPNYAEYSLATKMAASTEQVVSFLRDLGQRSLAMAKQELDALRQYAREAGGPKELEAWDMLYYAEKLRQHKYAISQEELKPYFPEDRVLTGMFALVQQLYDITIAERKDVDVWHKDVRFFEIKEASGEVRGQFYLDLYARPDKRGGAWMDECIGRLRRSSGVQTPVAYLVCNFSPPVACAPAMFTHDEVLTMFHEFGHGLHHMMTQVDYAGVSGISGVPWDAVELPSQFMENWCWQREVVDMISGHFETGDVLPQSMFEKLSAAKNFQSGMQMARQLEFSLFDFRLHLEYSPDKGARIYELLDDVRREVAVIEPPSFNRFPHSFSHIFAGGYAAGYYSYKWAEVLSSDVFAHFEEHGVFDKETGLRFLTTILEQGGSRDPMDLFIEFRGREPRIDALLRHSGIA